MYENIIELKGKEEGPTSMILVGVHGNEKCGIEAVGIILHSLIVEKGRVLIAYGNPRAITENVRFTESNLNRLFKSDADLSLKERGSYEYSRAQFLKKYLDQADCLLDIHASLTPDSKSFVICEDNAEDIVKYLPVTLKVSGFDQVQPGGTDYYMNTKGKVGICVECGYIEDPLSTTVAEKSILAFLLAQGNIAGDVEVYDQFSVKIEGIYRTKSNSFTLAKKFQDFEEVSLGEIIGVDGVDEVRMPVQGIILFARNRSAIGEEAFLYGQYKKGPARTPDLEL
jgi:succinylglutamate desuccinylase